MATVSATNDPAPSRVDSLIDERISQVAAALWRAELVRVSLQLATTLIVGLIVWVVVDHWIYSPGAIVRTILFLAAVAGGIAFVLRRIVPLVRSQIRPEYAARTLERDLPELRHGLVSYVTLRGEADTGGLRSGMIRSLGAHTAGRLKSYDHLPAEATVTLPWWMAVIASLLVLVSYAVLSPKNTIQSAGRLVAPLASIAPAKRVAITDVLPGDAQAIAGRSVEVSAVIRGLGEKDEPRVEWSSEGKPNRSPLALDSETRRFVGSIELGHFASGEVEYRVVAGDAIAGPFVLRVDDVPLVVAQSIEYQPPSYTREQPYSRSGGAITALDGTLVTLKATTNRPVTRARLEFNPRPLGQTVQATAGVSELAVDSEGTGLTITFPLRSGRGKAAAVELDSYRVLLWDEAGQSNPEPIVYPIRIIADLAPEVTIVTPRQTPKEVPIDAQQIIEIHAIDADYGLSEISLEIRRGIDTLAEPVLWADPAGATGNQVAEYRFRPAEHGLRVGDVVAIAAIASDNRAFESDPSVEPNRSRTDAIQLKITMGEAPQGTPELNDGLAAPDDRPAADPNAKKPEPNKPDSNKSQEKSSEKKDAAGGGSGEGEGQSGGGQSGSQGEQGSASQSGAGQSGENQSGANQSGENQSGGGSSAGENQSGGGQSGENQSGSNSSGGGQNAANSNPGAQGNNQDNMSSDPSGGNGQANQPNGGQSPSGDAQPSDGAPSEGAAGNGQPSGGMPGNGASGSTPPSNASDPAGGGEGAMPPGQTPPGQTPPDSGAKPQPGAEGTNAQGSESQGSGTSTDSPGAQDGGAPSAPPKHDGEAFERMREFIDQKKNASGGQGAQGEKAAGKQPAGDKAAGEQAAGSESSGDKAAGDSPAGGQKGAGGEKSQNAAESGKKDGSGEPMPGNESPQGQTGSQSPQSGKDSGQGSGESAGEGPEDGSPGSDPANNSKAPGAGKEAGDAGKNGAENDNAAGKPGEGSDASKAGGEPGKVGEEAGQPGESAGDPMPDGSQPGDASAGDSKPGDSKAGDSKPGDSKPGESGSEGDPGSSSSSGQPNGSQPQKPGDQKPSDARPGETGASGPGATGAGAGEGSGAGSPGADAAGPVDEPDLEYTKQATDMVLDYLNQTRDKPDRELLEKLNWTEQDLRAFTDRWESLRNQPQSPLGESKEIREALESLGMRPSGTATTNRRFERDGMRGLQDSGSRQPPPPAFRDAFDAFRRAASRQQ